MEIANHSFTQVAREWLIVQTVEVSIISMNGVQEMPHGKCRKVNEKCIQYLLFATIYILVNNAGFI